jgi:hypothetical protein
LEKLPLKLRLPKEDDIEAEQIAPPPIDYALLEELTLDKCIHITDIGLGLILAKCKNLKKLSLVGCQNITGNGLMEIPTELPYLEELNVIDCPEMSAACIQNLKESTTLHTLACGTSGHHYDIA